MICDRYAYSGVAYTAAKGLDFNWCLNADRGLIEPDLIFYIDIDKETIKQRAGFGDERYEKVDFQEKVREQYHRFQDMYVARQGADSQSGVWVALDAKGKSIEELHEEIKGIVSTHLKLKEA